MASSVKSLKSHLKQSPLFAASMEAVLCCLSFSLAAEMSLNFAGGIRHGILCRFFLPHGVMECVTQCWYTRLHSLKGFVSPGFSLVALQVQSFNLRVLACL